MLSTHWDNSLAGSAGRTPTYRSTRPNGRAPATAPPGPTATVQRTDSASAPGIAPQASLDRLYVTRSCWSGSFAPPPDAGSILTSAGGHPPPGVRFRVA
jgi:hypothetical protein